jgi:hypothetical protein
MIYKFRCFLYFVKFDGSNQGFATIFWVWTRLKVSLPKNTLPSFLPTYLFIINTWGFPYTTPQGWKSTESHEI